MKKLSKEQMKRVIGGLVDEDKSKWCNVYCGPGAAGEGKCAGNCPHCGDAGNGSGSQPSQKKMCLAQPDIN